jgi:hypothetical protein
VFALDGTDAQLGTMAVTRLLLRKLDTLVIAAAGMLMTAKEGATLAAPWTACRADGMDNRVQEADQSQTHPFAGRDYGFLLLRASERPMRNPPEGLGR